VILVVGATGQLGSLVVPELGRQGRPVRAMLRPPDRGRDPVEAGAELVAADLPEPATLDDALRGVHVIATANAVAPTHRGDSHDSLARGYPDLLARAQAAGVERFVYASVPETPLDGDVPMIRAKRTGERLLAASGMSYAAPRMPPFIEVRLALVGSSIPVRGELRATVHRHDPVLRRYRGMTGRSIEDRGVMVLPGRPRRATPSSPCTTRRACWSRSSMPPT
jgi:uncharacterized protein YbjT (DUF2867 family)